MSCLIALSQAQSHGALAQSTNNAEVEFWRSVADAKDPAELDAYTKAFPAGQYVELAKLRAARLRGGTAPEKAPAAPSSSPTDAKYRNLTIHLDLFGDLLERVRSDYVDEPDDGILIEAAIQGMLQRLDPQSEYFNPKRYAAMQKSSRGDTGGIGVELTAINSAISVVAPIDDAPAYRAGIKPGDVITHIDGVSLVGLTLEQVVEMMRGPVNSSIKVTVVRRGNDDPIVIAVTREVVRIDAVKSRVEDDVAYVRISTFNEATHNSLMRHVGELKAQLGTRLQGFVIDLRNNPGGLFDQAISVADDFLETGLIVISRGRKPEEMQRATARPGDLADGKPIVVLINRGSASASEIVAGALQDHKRAKIIGTRSHGVGTVQTIVPLGISSAVRLTTSRHYTPSGRSVHRDGIAPDVVVEQVVTPEMLKEINASSQSDWSAFVPKNPAQDTQLQAALNILKGKARP